MDSEQPRQIHDSPLRRRRKRARLDLDKEEDSEDEMEDERKRFQARTKCAGTLLRALEAINNNQKAQIVAVTVNSNELRFDVDDLGKCLQASAVIPRLAFEEFKYEGTDRLSVRLSLHLLIQCMSVFGPSNVDNTNVTIVCDSESDILCITLDVDGVVTECELATLVTDDVFLHNSFVQEFRTKPVINQAIVRSERLREAFSELSDCPGASAICLTMSPREPQFRMEARGSLFTLTIDLASSMMMMTQSKVSTTQQQRQVKSDDTFIDFKSVEHQMCKYRVKYLKHVFRALSVSKETMIQINEAGMLLVDHMLLDEGRATKIYVHCALYPLEDLGEEEGEDEETGDEFQDEKVSQE
jgi:hypothetical protein